MAHAIKDSQIQEVSPGDIDVEIISPKRLVGTHANVIPLISNTQSPRTFYGARFVNQSMPIATRETPLVQALDPEDEEGRSFEDEYGEKVGARLWRSDVGGTVTNITEDGIEIKDDNGKKQIVDLYHNFPFNRKTAINSTPKVKVGDKVTPGQLLASSNYTDDNGTLAMGVNARVAMVPFKGHSMDDAIAISQSFADRLKSDHFYEMNKEKDDENKFGTLRYRNFFPERFTKEQIDTLDENGVVRPGTVLHKGDPVILAVKPRKISANGKAMGRLQKLALGEMEDAAETWEHDYDGMVTDVADGKKNHKVFISAQVPTKVGDKIIFRNGNKDIVSKIIPDEHMLRSLDGQPFEVLLNPLSLPSRVNTATLYELALGKIAKKTGKTYKIPAYTKHNESRLDFVLNELKKNGLEDTEEVFDPTLNKKLLRPITTGVGYIQKLHHVVESKKSARGNGSYDQNMQPRRGGDDSAQAKRLGGLENTAIMSKGGYAVLREASTIRGTRADDYWRDIRQGFKPAEPGTPFVFDKFKSLLAGAGVHAKDMGGGTLRLAPFTDKELEAYSPIEVLSGKLVNPDTMESIPGGLFDPHLIAGDKWGKITLPTVYPNPAFEKQIAQLLNIKQKDLRKIIAGEMTMDEAMNKG